MTAKKKTFKEDINPVMKFISQPEDQEAAPDPEKLEAPEHYKRNPLYIEKRDIRLALLVTVSLKEKLTAAAAARKTSINDLVNTILDEALKED